MQASTDDATFLTYDVTLDLNFDATFLANDAIFLIHDATFLCSSTDVSL